jgi:hypothetical protein
VSASNAANAARRAGPLRAIHRTVSAGIAAGFAAVILAAPRIALACAVCTAGREDESNAAFLVSTIFLSLLPLIALGTLVYVLWRRFQKLELAGDRTVLSGPSSPRVAPAAEPSGARS